MLLLLILCSNFKLLRVRACTATTIAAANPSPARRSPSWEWVPRAATSAWRWRPARGRSSCATTPRPGRRRCRPTCRSGPGSWPARSRATCCWRTAPGCGPSTRSSTAPGTTTATRSSPGRAGWSLRGGRCGLCTSSWSTPPAPPWRWWGSRRWCSPSAYLICRWDSDSLAF